MTNHPTLVELSDEADSHGLTGDLIKVRSSQATHGDQVEEKQ